MYYIRYLLIVSILFLLNWCFFDSNITSNNNDIIKNEEKLDNAVNKVSWNSTDLSTWSVVIINDFSWTTNTNSTWKILEKNNIKISSWKILIIDNVEKKIDLVDTKSYFKITNFSIWDSVFWINESELSKIDLDLSEIEISWITLWNVDRIDVDFKNNSSKFPIDHYTLKKFKQGDISFKYNASSKYQTLDLWLNEFIFTAYSWWKEYKIKLEIFKKYNIKKNSIKLDNYCFYGKYCFDKDKEITKVDTESYLSQLYLDEVFKFKDKSFFQDLWISNDWKEKYFKAMIPWKTFYWYLKDDYNNSNNEYLSICNYWQILFSWGLYILRESICWPNFWLWPDYIDTVINKKLSDYDIPKTIIYWSWINSIILELNTWYYGGVYPWNGDLVTSLSNYKLDIEKYLLNKWLHTWFNISFSEIQWVNFSYNLKWRDASWELEDLISYKPKFWWETFFKESHWYISVYGYLYIKENIDNSKLLKINWKESYFISNLEDTKKIIDKYLKNKIVKKTNSWSCFSNMELSTDWNYFNSVENKEFNFIITDKITISDLPIFQINKIENGNKILSLAEEYCLPKTDWIWKPAIYVYDKFNRDNQVIVTNSWMITYLKPDYNIKSWWDFETLDWKVIVNWINYDYLRYELEVGNYLYNKDWWLVEWTDIFDFLSNKLDEMNFNKKEKQDFLDYWVDKFDKNNKYYITFKFNDDISKYVKLDFKIKPDSLFRVIMEAEKVLWETNYNYNWANLERIKRDNNLTIVEWWGVIRK